MAYENSYIPIYILRFIPLYLSDRNAWNEIFYIPWRCGTCELLDKNNEK